MPRIIFYTLSSPAAEAREAFACRLALKAWRQGLRVWLLCRDQAQAHTLNQQLWDLPNAFMPNAREDQVQQENVICGWNVPTAGRCDLLINLTDSMAFNAADYASLAEILHNHEDTLAPGRERFRQYRKQGYDPQKHAID
ncbi:MAG: DNA polymerase III subunit chi [Halopseudomonas yangmingensis]|uniref:DNA polymerase III, chi subunit n=1 Tax=Halopseudomonas yangmingensis TaxID=1720063 RepID=A0A1I4RCV8_9GAMM|nr:DNA polymerase III subunit chi [Halopseudomonas yangmingensis]SFM50049.1 DNA polymerase III, chi subunit [Halopseudomonas yangmingensis]